MHAVELSTFKVARLPLALNIRCYGTDVDEVFLYGQYLK